MKKIISLLLSITIIATSLFIAPNAYAKYVDIKEDPIAIVNANVAEWNNTLNAIEKNLMKIMVSETIGPETDLLFDTIVYKMKKTKNFADATINLTLDEIAAIASAQGSEKIDEIRNTIEKTKLDFQEEKITQEKMVEIITSLGGKVLNTAIGEKNISLQDAIKNIAYAAITATLIDIAKDKINSGNYQEIADGLKYAKSACAILADKTDALYHNPDMDEVLLQGAVGVAKMFATVAVPETEIIFTVSEILTVGVEATLPFIKNETLDKYISGNTDPSDNWGAFCNATKDDYTAVTMDFTNCVVTAKKLKGWCVSDNELEHPSSFLTDFNGVPISKIAGEFANNSDIVDIIIPSNITYIGNNAFSNCESLTTISFPSSVTMHGFYPIVDNCNSLKQVFFEAEFQYDVYQYPIISNCNGEGFEIDFGKIENIPALAFTNCTIKQIYIPASTKSIGDHAFMGSTIDYVTLNPGLERIGSGAFANCKGISSLFIPDSVTSLGYQIVSGCPDLNVIYYSANNAKGPTMFGSPFENPNVYDVYISNGVKEIPRGCFVGTGVTSATIPDSVEAIGEYAFSGCNFSYLDIPESVKTIGSKALEFNSIDVITVYNKDLRIYYAGIPDTLGLMRGYNESTAHQYANEKKINFEAIDCNHTFVANQTTDSKGNIVTSNTCTGCGYTIGECTGTKSTHQWDNGVVTKNATCYDTGIKTFTCEACKSTYTKEIPHLEHSVVTNKKQGYKDSTCTAVGGYDTVEYCELCKTEFSKKHTTIAKKAHQLTAWTVTKKVTCVNGSKQRKCKNCSYTETAVIKATASHSYDAGVVTKAPTSSATGVLTFTCKTCKAKKASTLAKLAQASISKVTAQKKGFKLTWKKVSTAQGYQIRYCTSASMSSAKNVTIDKNSTLTKTISNLTAKRKYYIQIRTYKTIKNKKYYSSWSATKSVTTK